MFSPRLQELVRKRISYYLNYAAFSIHQVDRNFKSEAVRGSQLKSTARFPAKATSFENIARRLGLDGCVAGPRANITKVVPETSKLLNDSLFVSSSQSWQGYLALFNYV